MSAKLSCCSCPLADIQARVIVAAKTILDILEIWQNLCSIYYIFVDIYLFDAAKLLIVANNAKYLGYSARFCDEWTDTWSSDLRGGICKKLCPVEVGVADVLCLGVGEDAEVDTTEATNGLGAQVAVVHAGKMREFLIILRII